MTKESPPPRQLLLTLVLLLLWAPTVPSQGQVKGRLSAPDRIKLLKEVKKGLDQTKELIKWLEWGESAAAALEDGALPPAGPQPPGGDPTNALNTLIASIDAYPIPEADFSVPDLSDVSTLARDAMRLRLREAAMSITTGEGTLNDIEMARDELLALKHDLEIQGMLFLELAEAFESIWSKTGVPKVAQQLFFYYYDLRYSYFPLNVRAAEHLNDKLARLDVVESQARAHFSFVGEQVAALLAAERNQLLEEKRRIDDRSLAIRTNLDELGRRAAAVKLVEEEARDSEIEAEAAKADLQQARDEFDETSANLDRADQAIERYRSKLFPDPYAGYNLCDNRHPYRTCTHADKKAEWDQIINVNRQNLASSEARHERLLAHKEQLEARKDQLTRHLAQLRSVSKDLKSRARALRAELTRALDAHANEVNAAQKERQESRADVYFAQSFQDENALRTFLRRLQ